VENLKLANPIAAGGNRCPVSNSADVKFLCEVDGYQVWRCAESATDFVSPMPNSAELEQFYNRAQWFNGGERGGYVDYDVQSAPSLEKLASVLKTFDADGKGLSVLDVGCGYGTHLKFARKHGWNAFGVETSDHAREVAAQRYGADITIVKRAEDLLPQRFDLVLILDVIEHLQDPYKLFFSLFGRGIIDEKTTVILSTPNSRSHNAVKSPAQWAYRHPPSHLVFYSAKSLDILLKRLMFTDISIEGVVSSAQQKTSRYADEGAGVNDKYSDSEGLFVRATGSTFKDFMHERYVPGGFWKLTEYEHTPRYAFVSSYAKDANVLDFGCGTGYGSAFLARYANSVLGLDISNEAIDWAKAVHLSSNLTYQRHDDLGRKLADASFDLITCFEMIEHVDHQTQIAAVESMARMLRPGGRLIISTPDPRYTAPYGDNPYHLREMNEEQFRDLLVPHFKHIKMLKQWVRPSIAIGYESIPGGITPTEFGSLDADGGFDSIVGFVAICSNEEFIDPPFFCQFDTSLDFNLATLSNEHRTNSLRLAIIESTAVRENLASQVETYKAMLADTRAWTAQLNERLVEAIKANAQFVDSDGAKLNEKIEQLSEANIWLSSQRSAWEAEASAAAQRAAELDVRLSQKLTDFESLAVEMQALKQRDKSVIDQLITIKKILVDRVATFVTKSKSN
jgi:2-polyprenyl-3-methyl-5-hydroxy-6-metoxy-1,4-benzoquinol methylase